MADNLDVVPGLAGTSGVTNSLPQKKKYLFFSLKNTKKVTPPKKKQQPSCWRPLLFILCTAFFFC